MPSWHSKSCIDDFLMSGKANLYESDSLVANGNSLVSNHIIKLIL